MRADPSLGVDSKVASMIRSLPLPVLTRRANELTFTIEMICLESRVLRIIFEFDKNHMRRSIRVVLLLLIVSVWARAQVQTVPEYIDQVKRISERADV